MKNSWIQTYTGRQFWPLNPRTEDVDVLDIAHALSMTCRYSGHCLKFYSVAEHSVLMATSEHVPQECKPYALLHDASEAYVTDVCRPIKKHIKQYLEIERRLEATIFRAFGLEEEIPQIVKETDNRILIDEMQQNMVDPPIPWTLYATEPLGVKLRFWSPEEAKQNFLDLCGEYFGASLG